MATMNVSLPEPLKDWIEAQVKTGRYANVSDYVRDLIRRDQEAKHSLVRCSRSRRSERPQRSIGRAASGGRRRKRPRVPKHRLSRAAAADLDDIFLYTIKTFGLRQAERYYLAIRERSSELPRT